MVKKINEEIYQKHKSISVYFEDRYISDKKRKERMECFQKVPSATYLQFIMPTKKSYLFIQPKLIKIEDLGEGKTRRIYANGIIELFLLDNQGYQGSRLFSDGRQEIGKFDKAGELVSGYRINLTQQMEFINLLPLISYKEEKSESKFDICEIEGKLVVLEKTYSQDCKSLYAITDIPIETILVKASQRLSYNDGKSIQNILSHTSFAKNKNQFIEQMLASDEHGLPKLFKFSNLAALDIIEAGSKLEGFNPLTIVDTLSGRNLITQVAHWGSVELLNKIIELFPQAFLAMGQNVIAELLQQEHSQSLAYKIAKNLENQVEF